MFKKGFTLAEILIALGIVGIISAVTIPTLVSGSKKQSNASTLSVCVSSFENAVTSIMAKDGASDFGDSSLEEPLVSDVDEFVQLLSNKLKIGTSQSSGYDYKNIRGYNGNDVSSNFSNDYIYQMKNGAIVLIDNSRGHGNNANEDKITELGGSLYAENAIITFDVNGPTKPNKAGVDIFLFYLGQDGLLYPYGGKDVSIYRYGTVTNTWDKGSHELSCTDTDKGTYGSGCAGRVVSDGYKITY